MEIDFHAKNSGQYMQAFRKKLRKTDTDAQTDGLTDGQSANLKSPFLPVGD